MESVTKLLWFHLTPNFTLHMCKLITEVQTSGELGFKAENFVWWLEFHNALTEWKVIRDNS